MLLDLTRPALTSHSRELVLVEQLNDDVLARSRVRTNGVVSSFVRNYDSMVASRSIVGTPRPTRCHNPVADAGGLPDSAKKQKKRQS